MHSQEEILAEIDTTINQLLENAKALKKISTKQSYQEEALALEKTQESLIAHLIHMDEVLKKRDTVSVQRPLLAANVHDKLGRSGYLNKMLDKVDAESLNLPKKPKIHKRKATAAAAKE